ncbi:xanthine dehydrogenase family protein molybdopterin-binding subunit [Chloroflexota bacterium]
MAEEFTIVGKRLPRNDALAKAKGEAKFIGNIRLPRMLEAKFLRSPHAHARIINIDTSKAEALPGVKSVLTHRNVPTVHPLNKFEYLLDETVHYFGEEVAVVAAETREIAEAALELIEVEYEVLPAVFEPEEAMKPGAPLVHPEYGTNMFHGTATQPMPRIKPDGWATVDSGDTDKGFAEADYVVEGNYETALQYHCSPAPRTVICEWSGEQLICYADTAMPMSVHQDLAKCLGMSHSNVRVICPTVVGSFVGKTPEKIATLCALLAKRTDRPVRAAFTRGEDFIATVLRPSYKGYERIGVKKDGTITAIHSRFITNMGRDNMRAFWPPLSTAVNCGNILYEWQNSKADVCTVMTNIPDCFGMMGWGDTEGNFIIDRLIDETAEKIGFNPVDFRLKNCTRYGAISQSYLNIMKISPQEAIEWGVMGPDMDSFPECIRKAAEKARWQEKWQGWKTPVAINGAKRRGIGIAAGMHTTLYTKYSSTVKMNHDGTADVMVFGPDTGQGLGTALTQVVAETLGLQPGDVNVVSPDSAISPAGVGIFASCGTASVVNAAYRAALDVRQKLFEIAAGKLGASPGELEVKGKKICVKGKPKAEIPIAKACLDGWQVASTVVNPPPDAKQHSPGLIRDEKTGKVIYPLAVAATVVEVEVDTETGQLDVLKITSAHDVGRAINPQIVENQINTALTIASGWCRSEEYIIDKSTGVVLNPNLLDYKITTFLDMPRGENIDEIYVEFPTTWGPFGAKGFSETGTVTCAPAIANAVYNAIGVRIRGDHLTPERILAALGK